jgi:hypothetical protein
MKTKRSRSVIESIAAAATDSDSFGAFRDDRLRLEAVKSGHRRDIWRSALRVLGTAITAAAIVAVAWLEFCAA